MSERLFTGEFIEQAEAIVLDHLSNEQFGVSELAEQMNMSRSNLLRKIKKHTQLSASQFIRQVRLQKGKELLKQTELSISEISYQVGFGNTSYFIKCFRENYGYPPGEVRKGKTDEAKEEVAPGFLTRYRLPLAVIAVLVVAALIVFLLNKSESDTTIQNQTKSIAVLPFKNMSSDSSNLYFVNGLMESTLNNLQKIKNLRVVSRTSVEKYRNTNKTIAEIADELKVSYLVEGSGQRVGDQVLLNIHLIQASDDTPVWAEQYKHEVVDIFDLQNAVAKKIADAIQAKVTPAELQQIDKKPTENMVAYDYYLQGLVPFQTETKEGLEAAIPFFEKAIAEDPTFALVYAKLAVSYYFLDIYQTKKQYTDLINHYADQALLYDSRSAESLIAKAIYYMQINEFRLAVPYLEKALEYNPNSATVVQILADLYSRVIPDTGKYLKYALQGIQLDIEAKDSVGESYVYLHLANAFIQNGFVDQANKYINLSLDYNPKNFYAPYLKVFIQYAQHQNMEKATNALVAEWKRDTSRLDIIQEVAKFYYFRERYDSAYYFYEKFESIKQENGLNLYPQESLKIGLVYDKMGYHKLAEGYYQAYADYCQNDQSIYQPASLAMQYLHEGKPDLAIEQLQIFATKQNYQYWILLFIEKDPLMRTLRNHPQFDAVIQKIKDNFWENHALLKKSLSDKELI